MATRDRLHKEARAALVKDAWTITHDPLLVPFGESYTEIDLGAAKLLGAEKEERKIAVEIKTFAGPSYLSDFHLALGQFVNYREALRRFDRQRELFLAVPEQPYRTFFTQDIVRDIVEKYELRLVVFDPQREEVVTWIN